jgi:TetR/AcrR family acrAB operon transcriptional repressor
VRRTKADALATRDLILDCAERLFVQGGVSRTSLQHIALEAGVSRGAIYWHFEDKAAVFNAMMHRVKMPLESAMRMLDVGQGADPLGSLSEYAMLVFRLTVIDPNARRVFEIATLKIEFVDDMTAVRQRRVDMAREWMAKAEICVRTAVEEGHARADVNPRAVALGLWAIIDGLLRAWLIAPESFCLVGIGGQVVGTHLGSLRTPIAPWLPAIASNYYA